MFKLKIDDTFKLEYNLLDHNILFKYTEDIYEICLLKVNKNYIENYIKNKEIINELLESGENNIIIKYIINIINLNNTCNKKDVERIYNELKELLMTQRERYNY